MKFEVVAINFGTKSAFWLSCRCFVVGPTGDHTFLINAVLIVKYSRAEEAF